MSRIKRTDDPAQATDGSRSLADRRRPHGVKNTALPLDHRQKEAVSSDTMRR